MIKSPEEKWIDVKGSPKGINSTDDPSSIDPLENPDNQNISYDGGIWSPRGGSKTFAEKPAGEAGVPLQTINPKTSDGIEYIIAVYDNHFYLWHDENEEFIRINNTYVPTETDLRYGNVSWNNGRGDDRMYACNGVDNFIKWHMAVSTVDGAATAGASTITVADATRFPATGTLTIKGVSSVFTEPYTSIAGNIITLTNTLDQNVSDGASICMEMEQKSDMELGKVVGKHSSRLFVMNYYGGETTGWYSVLSDPEDYTVGSNVEDASTFVISDGNGGITGFNDFGEYAVIEKEDSFHSFSIVVSADLGSKLDRIQPIMSGENVGPVSQASTIRVLNSLLYPTRGEGFNIATAAASGNTTSINVEPLSTKIKEFANSVGIDNCRGIFFDQKAIWSVALEGGTQNLITLFYDTNRKAWGKYYNWVVKDWATQNGKLYYLDASTGNINQALTKQYHDNNAPYEAFFFTKRNDFGVMAKPKTNDLFYIEGYMTPASEFYIDVLFNENGSLKTQTYQINKDTPKLYISQPLTNALGQFVLGQVPLGWVVLSEIGNVSFFRCYLGISNREGYFNIGAKFYSNKQAFWGISGYSWSPVLENSTPANMVISPLVNS